MPIWPTNVSLASTSIYSVSFWLKFSNFQTNSEGAPIFTLAYANSSNLVVQLLQLNSNAFFQIQLLSGSNEPMVPFFSEVPFSPNFWYHFVLTQNSSNFIALYVNSILVTSFSLLDYFSSARILTGITLGGYPGYIPYNAIFDEIGIWATVFGPNQIIDLYAGGSYARPVFPVPAPPTSSPAMLAYWTLDNNATDVLGSYTLSLEYGYSSYVYGPGVLGPGILFGAKGLNYYTTAPMISAPPIPTLYTFSVSCWIQIMVFGSQGIPLNIPLWQLGTRSLNAIYLTGGSMQLSFTDNFYDNTANKFIISTFVPSSNWMHIVVTSNSSILAIYMNGVIANTYFDPIGLNCLLGGFSLFNVLLNSYTLNVIGGAIDEIGIWNYALDIGIISTMYMMGYGARPTGVPLPGFVQVNSNVTIMMPLNVEMIPSTCMGALGGTVAGPTTCVWTNAAFSPFLVYPHAVATISGCNPANYNGCGNAALMDPGPIMNAAKTFVAATQFAPFGNVDANTVFGYAKTPPLMSGNEGSVKNLFTNALVTTMYQGTTGNSLYCYDVIGPIGRAILVVSDSCTASSGLCLTDGNTPPVCNSIVTSAATCAVPGCDSDPLNIVHPGPQCVGTAPPLYTTNGSFAATCDWCSSQNHPHFALDSATFSAVCGSGTGQNANCELTSVMPFRCLQSILLTGCPLNSYQNGASSCSPTSQTITTATQNCCCSGQFMVDSTGTQCIPAPP